MDSPDPGRPARGESDAVPFPAPHPVNPSPPSASQPPRPTDGGPAHTAPPSQASHATTLVSAVAAALAAGAFNPYVGWMLLGGFVLALPFVYDLNVGVKSRG